ncbi:DNA primase [Mesonia aestuariivivens]|uniref:DNA primase n=1 Tax=Mesonia aestuariivivens TaxID=2796128 RepID=A0ABS6W450_9FLAO|nr:DNA primase [Mesonia aestuariivivens]MBW2962648.1 DNA primase [Mesonia aestuariivivens]
MIHKSTVDQVFDAARVEEVIGDFVQLKKSGSNYKGLSPFTDERSPSFMVSPVKQIWKDFSSGKGGNVVAFLMEHEHFNYPEAIKYLAKKYGIEIEETERTDEQKQQADERESMYLVSEFANQFFQKKLHKTEQGKAIGLSYFKERGFTNETIKKFDLGYSPDLWDAFTEEALKSGYKLAFLEKTGLSIVKEQKKFDRFKGRVMFPIHSMSGRTLGFGGRILTNDKKAAKYLNSPESDIYHKSKVLYGIYHAKQSIAKEDNCYLVEGYTDVIQMHQVGIENVVASSGTALTADQIRLINRLTKNITVLFDGDAAGLRASMRGIDLILEQGMNVKVCTFPEGEDPDSFAKANTQEEIQDFLQQNSKDFISFKASLLVNQAEGDPIKKAEVVRDMVNSIAKIPDQIQQEIYLKECTRIMDVSEDVLYSTLAQLNAKNNKESGGSGKYTPKKGNFEVIKQPKEVRPKVDRQFELERHIISLLLRYGKVEDLFEEYVYKEDSDGNLVLELEKQEAKVYEKIFLDLQEDEIEFTNDGFRSLYEKIIYEFNTKEDLKVETFINELTAAQASEITAILMAEEKNVLHRWEDQDIFVQPKTKLEAREVNDTILNLRMHLVKQKVAELMEDAKKDIAAHHHQILEQVIEYKKLEMNIAERIKRVL